MLFPLVIKGQKVENEEPTYKIGGKNVLVSADHYNHIIPGKSAFDLARERDEQRNKLVVRRKSQVISQSKTLQSPGARDEGLQTCRRYLSANECEALDWIVQRESGWNQYAINKNCCGLFQRLNRCSDEILSDFNGQMIEGIRYIAGRYQTAERAKAFWTINHWY